MMITFHCSLCCETCTEDEITTFEPLWPVMDELLLCHACAMAVVKTILQGFKEGPEAYGRAIPYELQTD